MKRTCTLLSAVALVFALAPAAHAYGMSGVGFKLGVTKPEDLDQTVTVGGHVEFEQAGSRLHLLPGLMMWSEEGATDINPNFDVYYYFASEGTVTPYLGTGLGIHILDFRGGGSDTQLGLNLFGGVRVPMAASHLFVEARAVAGGTSQFGILGGMTFHTH
jgi:hypothetical protein